MHIQRVLEYLYSCYLYMYIQLMSQQQNFCLIFISESKTLSVVSAITVYIFLINVLYDYGVLNKVLPNFPLVLKHKVVLFTNGSCNWL